ncbi:glycosyltransferase [Cronobacter dublinensis]|uniref:glycosyltransferase n=1 Tax=Cronobacter dublinensis TaxID=413497 RepID=UPI000CFB9C40|nr:glycosyltransferase [Cronobacter dublinensis]
MSHYAVITPPLYSHVHAMQALAQELLARGHCITFIQQAEARTLLDDPRIGFYPVGEKSHPPGSLARTLRLTAHPGGPAILSLINDLARTTDMLCRELPDALTRLGVDGLIVDQMEAAGGIVADALGLPFVSVACALPVNREPGLPLPVMPFRYAQTPRARKIYHASQQVHDWLMGRHGEVIAHHAKRFGLAPRHGLHDCLSPLAQISQTLGALDFPRQSLPACFHAVGPLRPPQPPVAEPLPDAARPRVFASLGTLQGHRYGLFRTIAHACRDADAELLVAHCGGLSPTQASRLEACGATRVTAFTDQPLALSQSHAVITHGGLNTVMDAVASGTPLLVVPLAFDQPGVAARVEHCGIGRRVSRFAGRRAFTRQLQALLGDAGCRTRLSAMQRALAQAGGATRAAQIAEQALRDRRPVMAQARP